MPKINKSIDSLKDPFRSQISSLKCLIDKEELPFIIFETLRSNERQEKLKTAGTSKAGAGQSPHNYGLACDFVLDTKKIKVRERPWNGKMYPDAWDYETLEAKAAYDRLGELAESIGLEWGGRWKFLDVPHVQLKDWKEFK
jgi:peptidoglycan L-alanyl-D-glutamate endopeptidase CwlK